MVTQKAHTVLVFVFQVNLGYPWFSFSTDSVSEHTDTTVLWSFFRDYACEPVSEEIFFWTLWCKGRYQRQTHQQFGWAPLHPTSQWPTSLIPHFYTRCPFCCNPPNLFWLWTGTKYAGLYTHWLGWVRKRTFVDNQCNSLQTVCPFHLQTSNAKALKVSDMYTWL